MIIFIILNFKNSYKIENNNVLCEFCLSEYIIFTIYEFIITVLLRLFFVF